VKRPALIFADMLMGMSIPEAGTSAIVDTPQGQCEIHTDFSVLPEGFPPRAAIRGNEP
jgi:hypothetical protein